jgi:hypothetical protein
MESGPGVVKLHPVKVFCLICCIRVLDSGNAPLRQTCASLQLRARLEYPAVRVLRRLSAHPLPRRPCACMSDYTP